MSKWLTSIIGLIILALGIVVLIEGKGSQEIIGIVIIAVSIIVILVGIGLLLVTKKLKSQKASTPADPEEEPPVF